MEDFEVRFKSIIKPVSLCALAFLISLMFCVEDLYKPLFIPSIVMMICTTIIIAVLEIINIVYQRKIIENH